METILEDKFRVFRMSAEHVAGHSLHSTVRGSLDLQNLYDSLELAKGLHYYNPFERSVFYFASLTCDGNHIWTFSVFICLWWRRLCRFFGRGAVSANDDSDGASVSSREWRCKVRIFSVVGRVLLCLCVDEVVVMFSVSSKSRKPYRFLCTAVMPCSLLSTTALETWQEHSRQCF